VILTRAQVTLVAVADGLGHGELAAVAARAFCAVAAERCQHSLVEIMEGAHVRLAATRGAAAALVSIDESKDSLEFVGVGNIDLKASARGRIAPVSTPGIVGSRIRKIKSFCYSLAAGDLLVVASDGVSLRFDVASFQHLEEQAMADAILVKHGKTHDDATCVVIRYVDRGARRMAGSRERVWHVGQDVDALWVRQQTELFLRELGVADKLVVAGVIASVSSSPTLSGLPDKERCASNTKKHRVAAASSLSPTTAGPASKISTWRSPTAIHREDS